MTKQHGLGGTVEYMAWTNMLARCSNPARNDYYRYGGVGVTVCQEWRASFLAFYQHIGPRPGPDYSVDRIDVLRGYEPGNVRWATRTEQQNNKRNNRRVIYRGKEMTAAEACKAAGNLVQRETVICRLNNGWTVEEAVETPPLFRRDPRTRRVLSTAE